MARGRRRPERHASRRPNTTDTLVADSWASIAPTNAAYDAAATARSRPRGPRPPAGASPGAATGAAPGAGGRGRIVHRMRASRVRHVDNGWWAAAQLTGWWASGATAKIAPAATPTRRRPVRRQARTTRRSVASPCHVTWAAWNASIATRPSGRGHSRL
ncbi:MAG: hypothetical protein U0470_02120 [Anaerolineae bacterium]